MMILYLHSNFLEIYMLNVQNLALLVLETFENLVVVQAT